MQRLTTILIAALLPQIVLADRCTLAEGYCVPIVACIERSSEFFQGRTYGQSSGTFAAHSSKGTACYGEWKRAALGMGVGEFVCGDGRTGNVVFYYLDKNTGTALGKGTTNQSQNIRFWAGHNLPRYFGQHGVAAEVMSCGDASVPLTS